MKERDFVSFEYKTKRVKAKDQTRVIDLYESFGWEVTSTTHAPGDSITLSLKRDRKLKHKRELVRLERQAENAFETINGLQRAKTLGANIFAYIFGCVAVLILGGGMSLIMLKNSIPALIGGIALGVVGITLCAVNSLFYKKLAAKKTATLTPVIEDSEEKLANILEQGNELLQTDII